MLVDGLTIAAGGGIEIRMLDARRGPAFPASAAQGDLWELTQQSGNDGPGIYEFFNGSWILRNPAFSALSYDLSGTVLGRPDPGAKVLYYVAARTFYIQAAMAGAVAHALQPSSTEQVYTVLVTRGLETIVIGSFTFSQGVEAGVFTPTSLEPIRIQRGDVILVIAPNVVDQTLADISFTLCGYLSV